MNEIRNTNVCEHVDDLIGFLYGELSEIEARRFERHLSECAACEAEMTAFGQVRGSIVEWRNESLGLSSSPIAAETARVPPTASQPRLRAKSAFAAVREFLALSPLWMKGATAFATVMFCVCAVLAVAYLKDRPINPGVANANNGKVYTQQELNEQVAAAVLKSEQEIRYRNKQPNEVIAKSLKAKKSVDRPAVPTRSGFASASNPRRPFTSKERQELAADLRLVSSKDEDDLDITIDANHPSP